MKTVLRFLFRFFFVFFLETITIMAVSWVVPGVNLTPPQGTSVLVIAASVAIVLAIVNILVRPILVYLTLPLSIRTFGFFTLLINSAVFLLSSYLYPYFKVENIISAIVGSLLLGAINTLLTSLTPIDDDYSFFDGVIQWLSSTGAAAIENNPVRGVIYIEIDGLAFPYIRQMIDENKMSTLKSLLDSGSHQLSRFECGLPSQTSSSQAGLMYGNNFDIPAFRWYEKENKRMVSSSNLKDAYEMNLRLSSQGGLLSNGTSINNLFSGDAHKALMTASLFNHAPSNVDIRGAGDLYLVFLNPYFFTRTLVLTLWDALTEVFQGFLQILTNMRPRISRLHKGYPFRRAFTNVFLREISCYLVILNIMRGSPTIYTTFTGYDEIAHHSRPDSREAFNSLKNIDRQIRRIMDVVHRKAPRPYEFIILSDHGQSLGATFQQRYGVSLSALIQTIIHKEASVAQVNSSEDHQGYIDTLLNEMDILHTITPANPLRKATVESMAQSLESSVQLPSQITQHPLVLVGVSGNLAHIYFTFKNGKIELAEIQRTYLGLLETLVDHPGIGLVVGYGSDSQPIVMSKTGVRDLLHGIVKGFDPLPLYGDPDLRAKQLLRLANFPHSGDLILVSSLYPDGQVAAFEELVGSHGGLGGSQSDAFILHPIDMVIPAISNSVDLYPLLKARQGRSPVSPLSRQKPKEINSWSPEVLLEGLKRWRIWGIRALRALWFDQSAFREVADDPYATGPALLILFVVTLSTSLFAALQPDFLSLDISQFSTLFLRNLLIWWTTAILASFVGQSIGGKGSWTNVSRALAYAELPRLLGLLDFIKIYGAIFGILAAVLVLVARWIALSAAFRMNRLRAALIPIASLVVFAFLYAAAAIFINGLDLTFRTLLQQMNLWIK